MKQTIKYQLISASGNPTAIVKGQYDLDTKRSINQAIFSTNTLVEQIGYVYSSKSEYYLNMMGNEFSGNGCRAACYSILKSVPRKIKLISSGTSKTLSCSLDDKGNTFVSIPYSFSPQNIIKNDFGFLIKMFGSYQLVINDSGSISQAKKIIDSNFPKSKAVGIMYFEKYKNGYKLNPFFWVKETGTLVNETACGSGSVALAIYLSYSLNKSFRSLNILQPSGIPIFVNMKNDDGRISFIKISGPTKLIGDYNVKI